MGWKNKKKVWIDQDIIDGPCCMYDGLPGRHCNQKFRPPTSISTYHKSVWIDVLGENTCKKLKLFVPLLFWQTILYKNTVVSKLLERIFCKKRQKIVPDQLLVWEIRALYTVIQNTRSRLLIRKWSSYRNKNFLVLGCSFYHELW